MYASGDHSNNLKQGRKLIKPLLSYCDSMKPLLMSPIFSQEVESKVAIFIP